MDRLTKEFKPGWYGLVKVKESEQEVDSPYPNTLRAILESFKRLGEYEDTGLTPEQVAEFQAENARLKLEMDQAKNKVFGLFEKSDQLIEDQSAFIEELQGRLSTAEKVCSAAYMYIKHINSPLCVGWDLLLDALRKWTDERRPRDEGKEESE